MDARQAKALHIAATNKLEPNNGQWIVPSQSGSGRYKVHVASDQAWRCTCPDYEDRLDECKHIIAVQVTIQRETGRSAMDYSEVVKTTYSQDWAAYNRAQCDEKRMVLSLLADLCANVENPPHTIGRPRLPLSDMIFAVVYKVYAGTSARRFTTDLNSAAEAGLIDQTPAFNSVLRYLRDPELTPVLTDLVSLSALPLREVERDFAVDSSGFGTKNTHTWFSTKHGREMTAREWRKVHAMCGVSTHIVTAVEVTDSSGADSPRFPDLVRHTAKGFDIAEVSADKGYSSKANAAVVEEVGAAPFIAFKVNTVEPRPGSAWARMWHMFAYRQDEFLDCYHKRSNVETVFSMIKAKFGDSLFSRSPEGQTNEVLAKVVAHNLCVLVQAFYELGIEPDLRAAA